MSEIDRMYNEARGKKLGVGWLAFAASLLVIVGIFKIFDAIWAFKYDDELAGEVRTIVFDQDLTAWGWIWLLLGILLIVAGFVAVLSVAIGTMAALALARMAQRQAEFLIGLISVPMMLPALIIGVAMKSYFVRLVDLPLGLPTVIIGHLVIAQPFVILIVFSRMATFDVVIMR